MSAGFGHPQPPPIRPDPELVWQVEGHEKTISRYRQAAKEALAAANAAGMMVPPARCPNPPACRHDLDQHRYNQAWDRWDCSVTTCPENPDFEYPPIGVKAMRSP